MTKPTKWRWGQKYFRSTVTWLMPSEHAGEVDGLWSWRSMEIRYLQLFWERLSYKRGKAYATMPKVTVGNGGFYGCLSELQCVSVWWKGTAQTRIRFFPFLVAESPWNSIKQSQTLTTHNANRHCRVRFYTFIGQPLSKQLYSPDFFWRYFWFHY